jgi:hypothetical protein
MQTYKKETGFRQFEMVNRLEIGSIYIGDKNHYKIIDIDDKKNSVLIMATKGHDKSIVTALKSFLMA